MLNTGLSELAIDAAESPASFIPISRTAIDVKILIIHSILPCPKRCVFPPPYPAILNPKNDTSEVPASDRLLKPSADMATELLKNPTVILAMHKNKFNRMPTTLDRAAYAFFTFGLETSFLFLINSFTNKVIIINFSFQN